jgi:hypothetical protein
MGMQISQWLEWFLKPKPRKLHNCKERGCAIEDHKFTMLNSQGETK